MRTLESWTESLSTYHSRDQSYYTGRGAEVKVISTKHSLRVAGDSELKILIHPDISGVRVIIVDSP